MAHATQIGLVQPGSGRRTDPPSLSARIHTRPGRIAAIYALFGALWIVATDYVAGWGLGDGASTYAAQTAKGLVYIGLTTVLVYGLARRAARESENQCSLEMLGAAEHLLITVLSGVGEAVIMVHPSSRTIIRCNEAAERLFGYSSEELLGQSTAILHTDEGAFRAFARLSEPDLEAEGVFRTQYDMRRKDGTTIQAEVTVRMTGEDGEADRSVVSVIRDVTRRTAAERALRESEAKFRLLAENTLDVIWATDPGLVFTYVNPAITRLTGHRPGEFVGTSLGKHCPEQAFRDIRALTERMASEGPSAEGVVLETELLHKDGSRVPVEVHGRTLFDADGNPTGFQGTTRSIAERRRLENQIHEAQKLEAVGQLAGGIAHDFNNLLTVILGVSQMALMKLPKSDALYGDFKEIFDTGERAADLTRQVLAFARRQPSAPQVLDVNETVEGLLKMLRRLIGEDIDLRWKPTTAPCLATMDPGQVDQILANLIVNARDAISGTGTIAIQTGVTTFDQAYCDDHVGFRPGSYVMLSVSDTGEGMDRKTKERIFEPFFTTKGRGRGTGLGLSTVYGIVRQNHGMVNVYSEPGHGTTIRIYVPRLTERPGSPEAPPEQGPLPRGTETVLVAEDESSVLRLTTRYLESLGYTVLPTESPATALEIVEKQGEEIDLLITDIVMPEMDGRELWDRVRHIRPGFRCLFMSGYAPETLEGRGVLDEAVRMIQKPFTIQTLAASTREVLDRPDADDPATSGPV